MLANERLLRRESARYLPRDMRHEFQELYSDVVYGRACSIMATYDPWRDPPVKPITHLCVNVRWYAFKWVTRPRAVELRASLFDPSDKKNHGVASYHDDHDSKLRVESALKHLPEDARRLLEWAHCKEYTVKEIADHLEVSQKQAREELEFALELAKDYQGL